jgi:hypothetical protein
MDADPSPTESAARFGGFVMAHAALIASELVDGELVCPFAVVTKGENREVLNFEADTQAEAVEKGKASLLEFNDHVDLWALAREGLQSHPDSPHKTDVLLVSAWARGMQKPLNLIQAFAPAHAGGFALLGELEILNDTEVLPLESQAALLVHARAGIGSHPRNVPWVAWHGH